MDKIDRKKIAVKKVSSKLTAADLVPDERGPPVRFDWNQDDINKMRKMAHIGMTNLHIAHIMDCSLSLFDQRIALDKKRYEEGDRNENNIYCMLEKSRAEGSGKIIRTIYELAVEDRHPTMLIWLSKTRLGWREQIDVNAEHKHTLVYETQITDGVLRQDQKQLEASQDVTVIDAMIDEVTEKICPKPALE